MLFADITAGIIRLAVPPNLSYRKKTVLRASSIMPLMSNPSRLMAPRNKSYLLFLSRISHEKGPHLAIEVAKKLEMKLIIAGNVDTVDEQYFRQEILPKVDGDQIKYVGEADFDRKLI